MAQERRNHYRVLHVQPEAPLEVIKSSYRALIARLHPDAGGNHEQAVRLNAAYAVLSDPQKRRVYDLTLPKGGVRNSTAPGAGHPASASFDPLGWLAARRCPFCRHAFTQLPGRDQRCLRCSSPLTPAPNADRRTGELLGRRQGTRYARDIDVRLVLPADPQGRVVRLRDLSITGLSLLSPQRMATGSVMRVVAQGFDTVTATVACRATHSLHGAYSVHAKLLTLELVRSSVGVYVNATA